MRSAPASQDAVLLLLYNLLELEVMSWINTCISDLRFAI